MDRHCVPPLQIVFTIIALLPKPKEGDARPIGILSFFYRIYARLHRVEVLEWEENLDKEWDAAVRNNSALQEAITQMLYDEAAIRAGKTVIEIYLDIKKFYDHISW